MLTASCRSISPRRRRPDAFLDRARAAGIDPGFEDVVIAATGKVNDLTVLTRNIKDFVPLGTKFLNPFDALPL
jgi:predicted nucleic acid-binding protein